MELKNACTVHRVWGSLTDAELLAAFQHPTDAEVFCRASIEKQPEHVSVLIYVNHYDGAMHLVHRSKKEETR